MLKLWRFYYGFIFQKSHWEYSHCIFSNFILCSRKKEPIHLHSLEISSVFPILSLTLLHVTSIFTNISTTIHNYPCTEVFPSDTVVINQMSAGLKKITNEWLCCQIKRNSSCLHSYSLSPLFESCIYLSAFYFYGI